jgi:hypothetical protein
MPAKGSKAATKAQAKPKTKADKAEAEAVNEFSADSVRVNMYTAALIEKQKTRHSLSESRV